MTEDEITIYDQAKTIKQLYERIRKFESNIHPAGSAKKVFSKFWEEHKSLKLTNKELASLAFDAGHALVHSK